MLDVTIATDGRECVRCGQMRNEASFARGHNGKRNATCNWCYSHDDCPQCGNVKRRESVLCNGCARSGPDVGNGMRQCRGCDQIKPIDEFVAPPGAARFCLRCNTIRTTERRYGMEYGTLQKMHDDQDGRCAICGVASDLLAMHVDHDHGCCSQTPTRGDCNRGLLCAGHNVGLGLFGDDWRLLVAAVEYLRASALR